jgi:hypothetical protein
VHIAAKRVQEAAKRIDRKLEAFHGVGQRDEQRIDRASGEAGVELLLPCRQMGETLGRRPFALVGEVVGSAGEGVDRGDRFARIGAARRPDGEVLVVRRGGDAAAAGTPRRRSSAPPWWARRHR